MRLGLVASTVALAVALLAVLAGSAHATLTPAGVIGGTGSGDGQFLNPHGITIAGNLLYVADGNNNRIQKLTTDGAFLLKWGSFGSGNSQFSSPVDVSTDAAGNVYVADAGNYTMKKFDANGNYIQSFGQLDNTIPTPPGNYESNIEGVGVSPNGDVYVNERYRVNEFHTDGTFVRRWGDQGTGPGLFNQLRGVAFDAAGNVYEADCSNSRVQVFAPDGTFLRQIGTTSGNAEGQFICPMDVAFDPAGNLWVADSQQYAVSEFSPSGAFMQRVTSDDVPGGFRPDSIAFDSAGVLYLIDDQANTGNRLLKFTVSGPPLPPPVVAKSVNVTVERGKVFVKFPPGKGPAKAVHGAASRFVPLTQPAQIPVGSIVDARKGQLGMTAAGGSFGGLQTGSFYNGQFKVGQKKSGLTELTLNEALKCKGASKSGLSEARRRTRRLWGHAHGHFRTRGRYSTATVRGTKWLTKDTCTTTTTQVTEGTVAVRDLVKRRTILVRKGHSYVARKKPKRKKR